MQMSAGGSYQLDFVVKLGGSAVTAKELCENLNLNNLNKAVQVLVKCYKAGLRFVVAHGAGYLALLCLLSIL